jgi:hypothetical protein
LRSVPQANRCLVPFLRAQDAEINETKGVRISEKTMEEQRQSPSWGEMTDE